MAGHKPDDSLEALAGVDTGSARAHQLPWDWLLIAAACVAWLWLAAASLSVVWLSTKVPVTGSDLAQASWLSSYTTATHFSGLMAWAIAITMGLMGLAIATAKNSLWPILLPLAMISAVMLNTEQHMVRIGIATDTIKVGCFVSEMKECRVMLGRPTAGAPSRYGPDGLDAPWYVAARKEVITAHPTDIALQSVPGWAFLQAPLYVADASRINEKLTQQRAALAAD